MLVFCPITVLSSAISYGHLVFGVRRLARHRGKGSISLRKESQPKIIGFVQFSKSCRGSSSPIYIGLLKELIKSI